MIPSMEKITMLNIKKAQQNWTFCLSAATDQIRSGSNIKVCDFGEYSQRCDTEVFGSVASQVLTVRQNTS